MMSPPICAFTGEIERTFKFNLENLLCDTVVIEGEAMLTYSYKGMPHWAQKAGAPEVPCMQILLSVPYNATNFSIEASDLGVVERENTPLRPSPQPKANDAEDTNVAYVVDSLLYGTDALYPTSSAELSSHSFLYGDNLTVRVNLFPLRYNPVRRMLRKSSEIKVCLKYEISDSEPKGLMSRNNIELGSEEREIVKAMVENPEDVDKFSRQASREQSLALARNEGNQEEYKYLIITTRELEHSFRRIAALKRQTGYSVAVKCIEDILVDSVVQGGDQPSGSTFSINDDAGKLRQFLRDAWQNHSTQYVLLGGCNVPYRMGFHYAPYQGEVVAHVPTDLYLSDLSTDWNPAGSTSAFGKASFYNRFGGNNVFDLSPELFVGRLLGSSTDDIDNYTDKLFVYELNPGKGDYGYLTNGFFFEYGGIDGNVSHVLEYLSNSVIRRQAAGQNSITGASLINEINAFSPGFISFHCHGYYRGFEVAIYQEQGTEMKSIIQALDNQSGSLDGWLNQTGNGLDNLNNINKPNVMYTTSCDTEPYDIPSVMNSTSRNLGDSFTSGKQYGGIAYLGNTRKGYIGYSEELEDLFAAYLMNNDPTNSYHYSSGHIGNSEAYSKMAYDSLYFAMTHNLIGDPEVQVWTAEPRDFPNSVQVERYDDYIEVFVAGGTGRITACANDGTVVKSHVFPNGQGFIENASPNSVITITRRNYKPYIAPLLLQNTRIENSQYVIASDVIAGKNVDTNRTAGDVTIAAGIDYEIDFNGAVTLAPGFKVERGAMVNIKSRDF